MLINHVPTVAIQGLQHQLIFFLFRQKMLKKLDGTDFTNFWEWLWDNLLKMNDFIFELSSLIKQFICVVLNRSFCLKSTWHQFSLATHIAKQHLNRIFRSKWQGCLHSRSNTYFFAILSCSSWCIIKKITSFKNSSFGNPMCQTSSFSWAMVLSLKIKKNGITKNAFHQKHLLKVKLRLRQN